jgi:membrane protein HdeD
MDRSAAMSDTTTSGRRSGWSIALGAVMVLVGLVVLANAYLATIVSIYFVGWAAVVGGVVLLVQAVVGRRSGAFWSMALGGVVLLVLGVFVLRDPTAGLVTLTLLAGALFLVTGVTRIAVSGQVPEARWVLVIGGVISVLLGLWVLLNITTASVVLLGILLGVQVLVEGLTLLFGGRQPVSRPSMTAGPASGAPA